MSTLDFVQSKVDYDYSGLDDAFPAVDPGHTPFGEFVILQVRSAKEKTKGGIHLPETVRATDQDNTQVAKVIAIGPGAFRSRRDGAEWPEGAWYKVGDYVRCPKYGGDRWTIRTERKVEEKQVGSLVLAGGVESVEANFVLLKDLDVRAKITADPRSIRSFL